MACSLLNTSQIVSDAASSDYLLSELQVSTWHFATTSFCETVLKNERNCMSKLKKNKIGTRVGDYYYYYYWQLGERSYRLRSSQDIGTLKLHDLEKFRLFHRMLSTHMLSTYRHFAVKIVSRVCLYDEQARCNEVRTTKWKRSIHCRWQVFNRTKLDPLCLCLQSWYNASR